MGNNVHVICPHCGIEFELGDENAKVTPSKDIPDGIYALIPKNDKRLKELKKLGFDLSGLFGSGNAGNADKSENDDRGDDDIEASIREEGDVEGKGLWRRWVMGQMFRALNSTGGYDKYYSILPYDYSWKTLMDELKAQSKIKDPAQLEIRRRFFNKDAVIGMLNHYAKILRKLPKNIGTKKCNGTPYVHIPYVGKFFVHDINAFSKKVKDVVIPNVKTASDPDELYIILKGFVKNMIPLPSNTRKSQAWRNAFMGAGAYYTLDNLIRFHNCVIWASKYTEPFLSNGHKVYNVPLSKEKSLSVLDQMSVAYRADFYKLFALMKATIENNDYNYFSDPSVMVA